MSALIRKCAQPIERVIIYKGHELNPILGPYADKIVKRIKMFQEMNTYRKEIGRSPWEVITVSGEDLIDRLKSFDPKRTLLVIPAGESSNLDKVFSVAQTTFLMDEFFAKGGRGYFNCGSACWVSKKRIYKDLCLLQPEFGGTIIKPSMLPLFDGVAEGPLCPFPGKKYKVGFHSTAVKVVSGIDRCTTLLSGGGSFFPNRGTQKVKTLVKYSHPELIRLGKKPEECKKWENAAIMVSTGEGAAILSSFHPYIGSDHIDVELYEKHFPDCGTDWRRVNSRLSSDKVRMRFALNAMLIPLEDMDFQPRSNTISSRL